MHGRMLSSFIDPYGSRNRSLALGMIGGIGEGIGGYLWANNRNMSSGKASTMIVFGDLGALATLGTAHFTGFLDGQNSYDPYSGASNKALIRRTIGSYIIGNTAGMVVGSILSNNQNYTTGDAIYTGSAAAFGAYLPITLLIAAEADDVKSYSAAATLGGLAGMSLSHLVTKDKDYTTGQSVLITLGGGASGLFGLGLGYLFTSEATTAAALSGFTSLAGFVIMSKVYADKAKENQKDQAFSFQLNPEALLKLTGSTSPGISSSIVSTRFTF
ncbi:MAG: hypothetical protein IIA45_07715 [Bacteroidetes bacterium]|nr:hypothetical protein [Bacteroidota bacterium]